MTLLPPPTRIEDMAATVLIVCLASLVALSVWLLVSSSRHQVDTIADRWDCPRCHQVNIHPLGTGSTYCFRCRDWTGENGV